ncbi:MAG: hypothetical protein JXJ17_09215 [Anaerolineae bacterium]|nr:hypothetical protein [Anaerolineae bacterium]
MRNKSLNHTLSVLSHPIVIGAVVLLLVNDHLLRRLWPSVITGKLGDAAWLVFAPLMIAPLIALLFPNRQRLTGVLSIALTGIGFALIKTVGPIHAITQAGLSWMLGWPSGLRRDPTDLLTLPALGLTWWLWTKTRTRRGRTISPVVLAFALFATTANVPYYDEGIVCVFVDEDQTFNVVSLWGGSWTTHDGGLTWRQSDSHEQIDEECSYDTPLSERLTVEDPSNPSIRYRVTDENIVERSEDAGASWVEDIDLSLTEAQIAHYSKVADSMTFLQGPLDAAFDPKTGNLILAMGLQGAAVRTPEGDWQRIDIDRYEYVDMKSFQSIWDLLAAELILAAGVFGLFPAVLCLLLDTSYSDKYEGKTTIIFITWVLWLFVVFYSPAIRLPSIGRDMALPFLSLFVLILWGVNAVLGFGYMEEYSGRADKAGLFSLAAAILFILPYILWTQAIIPTYTIAMITALVLTVAAMASAVWWLRTHVELPEEPIDEASGEVKDSE